MKSWTYLVAALYMLILTLLTIPVVAIGLWKWPAFGPNSPLPYDQWPYWVLILGMGVCQLALLAVPVRIASRRPVTSGALWPTIAVIATMMGLLGLAAILSLYAAWLGDAMDRFCNPWLLGAVVVALWSLWAVVFRRLAATKTPDDFVSSLSRLLIRGSILELLVAVPCHIILRGRNVCCAGFYTMFGLAMGLSVMLFAFGPAVYFLFVARARRLQGEPGPTSPSSLR